jgi:hypothetical protein
VPLRVSDKYCRALAFSSGPACKLWKYGCNAVYVLITTRFTALNMPYGAMKFKQSPG